MTLRVGDVFFERVAAVANRDKKYFIVVCSVDPVRFVLINTRNAVEALGNPDLGPTQVLASLKDCDFLKYDSWIGCHDLFAGYSSDELAALISAGHLRGKVSTELLISIKNAIAGSRTIPERQKTRCVNAIDNELTMRADV